MTQAMQDPLSSSQMLFFDREGYLVVADLFSAADLQPVIDEVQEEIDRRARELVRQGKLSRAYEEEDFLHRLTRITAEHDAVFKGILAGQLCGPAIFNLIRNPRLLDVAEQMCGPELIASSVYRLRPKMPGHEWGPVPWHQDSGYFEPHCDRSLILTVWVPLVDATEERGCLWVIPRVHKDGVVRHVGDDGKVYLRIPDSDLPKNEPVCVPVMKGGALFLTNRTPHASFNNDTDIIRWSMDLRYQSASAPTNARMSRQAGEGTNAGEVPTACYPPEADFLVRSRERPSEVLRDAEAFGRLRREHKVLPLSNRWDVKFWDPSNEPASSGGSDGR